MTIHVVSAEFASGQWRAVKAFNVEDMADDYAEKIYEKGYVGNEIILDSRVDEVIVEV